MRRLWLARMIGVAAILTLPLFGFSYSSSFLGSSNSGVAYAAPGEGSGFHPTDSDRNGDLHSHDHTGAKGRGAGGDDKHK